MSWSSPTPYSASLPATRLRGCTLVPSTGISSIMSALGQRPWGTWEWPSQCVVPTVGQTTASSPPRQSWTYSRWENTRGRKLWTVSTSKNSNFRLFTNNCLTPSKASWRRLPATTGNRWKRRFTLQPSRCSARPPETTTTGSTKWCRNPNPARRKAPTPSSPPEWPQRGHKERWLRHQASRSSENAACNDTWLSIKVDEIQDCADRHDIKHFYDPLMCVYAPSTSGSSPMYSADDAILITDEKEIVGKWAEHFSDVLNRPSSINDEAIQRLAQVDMNPNRNVLCEDEVAKAIKQMSSGKSPGPDGTPAEVFKSGGPSLQKLTALFQSSWEIEILPQEFKDATIVHIYKRRSNKRSCDNLRGIFLLSIAGKIMARVLLSRLLKHLEQGHLPESQCGFRTGWGTTDMVFAAHQTRRRVWSNTKTSILLLLRRAFDTVSREGLWMIMSKFGRTDRFVKIARLL